MNISKREYFLSQYNNSLLTLHYKNKVGKAKKCFNCDNPKIEYDPKHDMIYCRSCGIVIRQNMTDYTPDQNMNYTLITDISFI